MNYIERELLVNELVRICRAETEIVVYDFEIDLSKYKEFLGINLTTSSPEYDHSTSLSEHSNFDEVVVVEAEISTKASPLEIAHLLLSSRECHDALREKYRILNPATLVANEISSMSKITALKSNILYSIYSMSQN